MDFKLQLKQYEELINKELEKYIKKEQCPESILNQSMEYSLMAGGKRLRPILMLATYKLFKEDFEKCIPFAVAMEMVHNFSLIHDDLPGIDNDDFRHGKLTNHKKYNEATAILAGDSLLNNSYIIISQEMLHDDIDMKLKIRAFNEFAVSIDRMIAGEYLDTEYEGKAISNDYLEYIHQNKTGALLCASVRIGAILAGASEEEIERLSKYSEKIGLAFQIKDDILSEIGDEKKLGKPIGNDKARGKCTYVTKYGLEEAKSILEKITKEALELIKYNEPQGDFLKELALYIKNREK